MASYDQLVPQIGYFMSRHCLPNWRINESVIPFIDLTYIFEGKATYIIDGISYDVEKGDLVCIPKYSTRASVTDPDDLMSNYAINFQLCNYQGEDVELPFPPVTRIGINDELISLYHELNLAWLHKNPGYQINVHATFLQLIHRYFTKIYYKNQSNPIDPRIQKVMEYIDEHFSASIQLEDLADLLDLNSVYFGTLFKKNTGLSVKKYINKIRVNNAENLIVSGEFTMHEVAQKCGFQDVFYFSRVYKNIKGHPPSKAIK
ncbi:AraC family transcriptional regulator [Aquibacillus koreensis]|uniref:AraC family transcriptional regulator n=1 Tax=Aquibacillus koreensis TaxID=279446 RepID=A0A9X3WP97_9BACI|nr:AraC family transcriptional regulator [Aquibacillus koreensis]MCT2536078.1 AraC family transcriptional regulator [Aquibacillus koreensis]MDC3422595.1 AraC family transcriptional regulator [Aquibacillus koreensis]